MLFSSREKEVESASVAAPLDWHSYNVDIKTNVSQTSEWNTKLPPKNDTTSSLFLTMKCIKCSLSPLHFCFVAGLHFWNSLNLQHMSCTEKRKSQPVVFLPGLGEFQGRCYSCSPVNPLFNWWTKPQTKLHWFRQFYISLKVLLSSFSSKMEYCDIFLIGWSVWSSPTMLLSKEERTTPLLWRNTSVPKKLPCRTICRAFTWVGFST